MLCDVTESNFVMEGTNVQYGTYCEKKTRLRMCASPIRVESSSNKHMVNCTVTLSSNQNSCYINARQSVSSQINAALHCIAFLQSQSKKEGSNAFKIIF